MFRELSQLCNGCCCGPLLAKNYLLNDHTLEQIFLITHNNGIHHITRCRGDQGGGISFFISYISLAIYTHIHLNTFHILSINNANKCGGTVWNSVDTHSPILPVDLHYTSSIYLIYTSIHILSGC